MSRQWSPAAEVARDKLFDQLQFSGLPAADRWQLIDAFAHELAEQIRADTIPELDEYGTREQQAEIDGRRGAADLIDPHPSAGPVRPGEEPTATPQPYCTGARCADCEPPSPDDVHGEGDCCEATCGCCPRVDAHGHCFLFPGSEEGSKYCDQHGEGWPY